MNSFATNICLGGIVGGCIGGAFNGAVGYFSQDTDVEYHRRILIGILAGAAMVSLGTAIALSDSTGAVLGTLAGTIFIVTCFDRVDDQQNERIFNIVRQSLSVICTFAAIGYILF